MGLERQEEPPVSSPYLVPRTAELPSLEQSLHYLCIIPKVDAGPQTGVPSKKAASSVQMLATCGEGHVLYTLCPQREAGTHSECSVYPVESRWCSCCVELQPSGLQARA